MVSPILTTLGEKRKLHGGTPERQIYEVTKAVDFNIYVDTPQPWDLRDVGRLSVWSDMAC
jgi:hypothetical protein